MEAHFKASTDWAPVIRHQLVLVEQRQNQQLPATGRSVTKRALLALDSASRGGTSASSCAGDAVMTMSQAAARIRR